LRWSFCLCPGRPGVPPSSYLCFPA
jgi:hypothetical protein